MHALVTGGGGFLGRYIVEQLVARGDRVRSFGRGRYPELAALGVEVVQGDLRNEEQTVAACAGIDVVFHVAGAAGIWGSWEHFYGINVLGTENVISGCCRHGIQRLVFTSSPSVTFDGGDQCGIDESTPHARHWLCHYPHTKALAEYWVLAANSQNSSGRLCLPVPRGDLLTCALRPHLIWGPRDPHLVPRLLERARTGKLRRVGDGRNQIDIIYVENAASAHLRAADALTPGSPVCGQAYFISQGEPVNCWQWIDQLLALAGLPPIRKSVPLPVARMAGWGLEILYHLLGRQAEPPMTRFLAAQLGRSHYFNIGRAQRDFGYQATVSTAEGMSRLATALAAPPR